MPDFTKGQAYSIHINKKYCSTMFPQSDGFYKLIVNCNKPKIYALVELKSGKLKCWLYVKGFPVPASKEILQNLVTGIEAN